MFSKLPAAAIVAVAASNLVAAQTFTECNPLKKTCPADPAFGEKVTCDFTKGECDSFQAARATNIKYTDQGAVFTINKENEAPTIHTGKYIFFGSVEVEVQAAPGKGIVTSVVLESDDLDEIDLEWVGSDSVQVQSNYFSKGNTQAYDRGAFHPVVDAVGKSHTYKVEWTADKVEWFVDGTSVRTLKAEDANSGFPETPMQIKLGTWCAGSKNSPKGTAEWAGGYTDFNQAPFHATYKSITIVDYSGGNSPANGGIKEYSYGDNSGTAKSIKVTKGTPDANQVKGENGITGGEGNENGSSSHKEPKTSLEGESSSSSSSPTGTTGITSPTGASGGSDQGDANQSAKPQTMMLTVAGGYNSSTASGRSSGPSDSSTAVPTSAAGFTSGAASLGALSVAVAAAVAQLVL